MIVKAKNNALGYLFQDEKLLFVLWELFFSQREF